MTVLYGGHKTKILCSWISSCKAAMYTHQTSMDALQLPSDEIWQVAEYGSSLAEAYEGKLI